MDLQLLQVITRAAFDELTPPVSGTMSRTKWREAQTKRRKGEDAITRIHQKWISEGGKITKKEAVRLAVLGVPVWAFVLRFFLRKLAGWVWDRLNDSKSTNDGQP